MLIKPLYDPREYDVFIGYGWENWVRVRLIQGNNGLEVISTDVTNIDPKTLQLIFFKIKKFKKKEGINV